MKRYSIVRVDGECPKGFNEDIYCKWCGNCGRLYGDTKKQMILKVAQVLFEAKLEIYKNVYGIIPNDKFMKDIYAKQLKVAKKIVEFLGVE